MLTSASGHMFTRNGTAYELVKDTDNAAAKTTDEVDIIIEQVLEETLMLGVNEEEHGGQGVDDTMFTEDFAQWLDDFVSRNSAPEIAGAKNITEVADITVYNLGVERIPADFLSMFAQGMACHSFVDSVVQRDSGDLQEVDITGDEEVDLVSLDVSTVYRSPSPIFQEVDSVEHDLKFALGPAIFPSVAQEERLYFVQSPASSPATYQPQESSSSSTDVSMHFDSTDVPLNAQADTQESAPVDFTMFIDALEDLKSSISQRIHDSNCEILSKVNAVEIGVREALFKQHVLLRQSLQDACRVLERQGVSQEMQINDLRKGLLASVATVFEDVMAIKKGQREQDAKITALDTQIAAIRNEQLDFQAKIAADILSLSTQIGDIADYIRGGDAKKREIGSSSRRPPPVRVERRPLPTQANQGESSSGLGRALSVEEAAEMVQEADRQADRRERERERERRLRRRGH
ncbi:hypothetical protein F511_13559 [Dorcoceras hygrometricum]|uniref:Uncharacterized protein n=1 Tax=Dorcoceras hygrometricum TaxID=472368 RepID=A0A2Z7D028_9LAMI|nr:hypothetical protein F511_13559 [Dorcoceras hygrometricum]